VNGTAPVPAAVTVVQHPPLGADPVTATCWAGRFPGGGL